MFLLKGVIIIIIIIIIIININIIYGQNKNSGYYTKLKQNPWKVPVMDFSKELFSKFEGYTAGYRPAILPSRSTKYELFQMFC